MADPIRVLRTSHDRFAALVVGLDERQVRAPSYAVSWSIADVAAHLGSQAEMFGSFLEAGLRGVEPPETFGPVRDRWDALIPTEQVDASVRANEAFVARVEALSPETRAGFAVRLFGRDLDLDALATVRLGEHALHTWDVAVTLDRTAVLPADAVEVLTGGIDPLLARAIQPLPDAGAVVVTTQQPERAFGFDLSVGTPLAPAEVPEGAARLTLPAESFVRLVHGRLDPDHTPIDIEDPDGVLCPLREAFPGF